MKTFLRSLLTGVMAFFLLLNVASGVFAQDTAPTVTDDDRKNQQNWVSEQQRHLKDVQREVQDVLRDAKDANVTKANELLQKYEACLNTQNGKIGTSDFWNTTRDCDDLSRDMQDEMQDNLRPVRDCANNKRNIEDRKREKKNNVDSTLKQITRDNKNADLSALQAIITQLDSWFAKADQISAGVCSRDVADGLNDINGELNTVFQDWYSVSRDVSEAANTARQMTDAKNDFEKNIKRQCEKEMGREYANFKKEYEKAQKAGAVPQTAVTSYEAVTKIFQDLCTTQIQAMQQGLDANDWSAFDSARQDFQGLQRDFWDTLNDSRSVIQQQEQSKNVLKEIENRGKEFARMVKEVERIEKQGGNASKARELLKQMEDLLEEANGVAESDPQSWWNDYQMQYNELQNEFWQSQQQVQRATDVIRASRDVKKELEFREKDLKKMRQEKDGDQSKLAEVEKILNEMKKIVQEAEGLLSADPEAAQFKFEEMQDLRHQWEDASRDFWESKQTGFGIDQVFREVQFVESELKRMVESGEADKEKARPCFEFIEQVRGKLEGMKREGNVDMSFVEGLEDEANRVCPYFEQIGNAPRPDAGYYRDFIRDNSGFDQATGDIAAKVLERVSQDMVEKILQKFLSDSGVFESLFQAAGEKYKDGLAGSLDGLNFYDEGMQKDLLQKKTQILELNKQLEELQQKVQIAQDKLTELQNIQNEIAGYNFYGTAGDDIRTDVENFLAEAQEKGLSKEVIRQKIDFLKARKDEAIQASKGAKFEANIIPFRDTDDNEWFTSFAAQMKNKGWITGTGTSGGQEFNPGGLTNVAEAIMMFARVDGIDEDATPGSVVGKRLPDWARPAAGTLEASGVNLDEIFGGKNPGDTVSRAEVARLLKQVLSLDDIDSSEANVFTDIRLANGDEKAAIAAVSKAGIMTGQGGDGPKVFDVKGPLNRAALAKILTVVGGE